MSEDKCRALLAGDKRSLSTFTSDYTEDVWSLLTQRTLSQYNSLVLHGSVGESVFLKHLRLTWILVKLRGPRL